MPQILSEGLALRTRPASCLRAKSFFFFLMSFPSPFPGKGFLDVACELIEIYRKIVIFEKNKKSNNLTEIS